jgi:hypothetical protein
VSDNVIELRSRRGYIEVQQCDLDLEEAIRAAYAVNGPVVSLIAQFREQCAATPNNDLPTGNDGGRP